MNVLLCHDETLDLPLDLLAHGLNQISTSVRFSSGINPAKINGVQISSPESYKTLILPKQIDGFRPDYIFVITEKPYYNNYFFEYPSNVVILSLFGWEHLTDLPKSNGFVYFICVILTHYLKIGESHQENCGCILDFLWDKRGVDVGMRAAFICAACRSTFIKQKHSEQSKLLFTSLQAILDSLSAASRSEQCIIDYWSLRNKEAGFDVFLCHNSQDKEEVIQLNERLKALSIKTWLDEEQLAPGRSWQDELELQIGSIRSALICVGSNGSGPWQRIELKAFIQEFVHRGIPVIPVVLESCTQVPELPVFLRQFTWVDLRKDRPDPLHLLKWGITGKKS